MIKTLEQTDPASCWNKAAVTELVFVLLGRDVAAPAAIRAWVRARIRLGKNRSWDTQILEALNCADDMEASRPVSARVLKRALCRAYWQLAAQLGSLVLSSMVVGGAIVYFWLRV